MGAAKEFLGNAVQEFLMVKKTAEVPRILPDIKHMKIVSESVNAALSNVTAAWFYVSHIPTTFNDFKLFTLASMLIKLCEYFHPQSRRDETITHQRSARPAFRYS